MQTKCGIYSSAGVMIHDGGIIVVGHQKDHSHIMGVITPEEARGLAEMYSKAADNLEDYQKRLKEAEAKAYEYGKSARKAGIKYLEHDTLFKEGIGGQFYTWVPICDLWQKGFDSLDNN